MEFTVELSDGSKFKVEAADINEAEQLVTQAIQDNSFVDAPSEAVEAGADTVLGANVPGDPAGEGITREFLGNLAFGLGDEIEAYFNVLVKSAKGIKTDVDQEIEAVRAKKAQFAETNPIASQVAGIGGALAGGIIPGGAITKGLTAASRLRRGVGVGAGFGAATGFAQGEGFENRLEEAATGGAIGAPLGLLGGLFSLKGNNVSVPQLDELKDVAQRGFEFINNKGFVINRQATKRLLNDLESKFRPRSEKTGRRIERAGKRSEKDTRGELADLRRTLGRAIRGQKNKVKGLDILELRNARRQMRQVAKPLQGRSDSDIRMANEALGVLDDFFAKLDAKDLAGGSPKDLKQVQQLLPRLNKAWGQFKKGELIAETIWTAGLRAQNFKGSGFENALRNEFRNLAIRIKKGRLGGFTDDEFKAIEKVGEGDNTSNFFRRLGALAPTGGGGQFSAAAGVAAFGPKALVGTAATSAGRALATGMTSSKANLASQIVRGGGSNLSPAFNRALTAGTTLAPAGAEFGPETRGSVRDALGTIFPLGGLRR